MGFGDIFLGGIGAFVRWACKGFKTHYIDEYYGPEDSGSGYYNHRLGNNIIGMIVLMIVVYLILKL